MRETIARFREGIGRNSPGVQPAGIVIPAWSFLQNSSGRTSDSGAERAGENRILGNEEHPAIHLAGSDQALRH